MTMTGIYLVSVRVAGGWAVGYAGTEDEYTGWLDELRNVETVLDVDVQEMTEDEADGYGPVYDGPCSDSEEDA
jgi:hypothetical protein